MLVIDLPAINAIKRKKVVKRTRAKITRIYHLHRAVCTVKVKFSYGHLSSSLSSDKANFRLTKNSDRMLFRCC